jgi:hypothetical protein
MIMMWTYLDEGKVDIGSMIITLLDDANFAD